MQVKKLKISSRIQCSINLQSDVHFSFEAQFFVFGIYGSTLRKSNAEALDGAWRESRAHLLQNSC
jgi:hypothetical protein